VYLEPGPEHFEQVGEFNTTLSVHEDYELNYRTRMAGGQIYLSPRIRSVYFCRRHFVKLWNNITVMESINR